MGDIAEIVYALQKKYLPELTLEMCKNSVCGRLGQKGRLNTRSRARACSGPLSPKKESCPVPAGDRGVVMNPSTALTNSWPLPSPNIYRQRRADQLRLSRQAENWGSSGG